MTRNILDGLRAAVPAPWVIYLALAMVAASALSGWTVRGWQCDASKLSAERTATKTENAVDDIVAAKATTYEQQREKTNVTREIRTNTIREIYRNVEVSPDCAPPLAADRVLRDSVTAANAAASGKSGGSVPNLTDTAGTTP